MEIDSNYDKSCEYITLYDGEQKCSTHSLHIEITQSGTSLMKTEEVEAIVNKFIQNKRIECQSVLKGRLLPSSLSSDVLQIDICDSKVLSDKNHTEYSEVQIFYHTYKLNDDGPCTEDLGGSDGDDVPAATHWLVPSSDFHNLWDSLIYESNIKEQLLKFVMTTLLFSDKGVNNSIISWNKVLLLHGPPGTGKTSLCKALAQKLSIRLGKRYKFGQLIEVNSHSLFSKWFSESGKLVQKMFSKITDLVEDPESIVFVLIDEVESLTRTRAATANGLDPSDALRVVNALLTQIDQIKRYPNVLILTTSNVTGNIDLAFVDRADIKQYIGPPSQAAIYKIYHSCLVELMETGIISPEVRLLTLQELHVMNMVDCPTTKSSLALWQISEESVGLSGRTLRKLPFLAHALHSVSPVNSVSGFLNSLSAAVRKHKSDNDMLKQ